MFDDDKYQDMLVKFWEGLARHYRDNPAVADYDLLNEPHKEYNAQTMDLYDRLYASIRAIDPHHILYLEGDHGVCREDPR